MFHVSRLRPLIALLLIVSAIAFGIGVSIERSGEGEENESAETVAAETDEAGEEGEAGEAGEESESILGINPESTGLVALAIAISLALALAVWMRPSPVILLTIIVVAAGYTLFDGLEALNQIDESNTGMAVLAFAIG